MILLIFGESSIIILTRNKLHMIKNLLALTLIFIAINSKAQQGEKNFIDQNYIEVSGKAELFIEPNLIYIKIELNEKNRIPIEGRESEMIKKLTDLGIDVKKDLVVNDLSGSFRSYIFTKNEVLSKKNYVLTVRNGQTAGKVFYELDKMEVTNFSIDKVDHTDIEKLRREVKVNAIKAAKEKAEDLTKAINQQIGRAIYVQEVEGYRPYNPSNISIRGVNSYGSPDLKVKELELDFEKIKIEYAILCRFILN